MRIELTYYEDEEHTKPNPAGLYFLGCDAVETKDASSIINREWLRVVVSYGYATYKAFFDTRFGGLRLGETGLIDSRKYDDKNLAPNKDYWEVPDGARLVSIEGKRDNAATQVTPRLLPLGK